MKIVKYFLKRISNLDITTYTIRRYLVKRSNFLHKESPLVQNAIPQK